jgi:hypothetical protein
MKPKKINQLEKLAREMVGDGKSPDLFFVSREGVIITITRDFPRAHQEWQNLLWQNCVCQIENRRYGVICQKDKDEETGRFFTRDDSAIFLRKARR